MAASAVNAQDAMSDAQSLLSQKRYAEALERLAPQESASAQDANYQYVLGRAALGAVPLRLSEQSLRATVLAVPEHLEEALALDVLLQHRRPSDIDLA